MNNNQSGFTLVELAIVMIIIGLLIGGILKGQELVSNARVTSTVAQIKGIDGAISTFRDKYSDLPGDILLPQTRLANCTAAPCRRGGNDDGRIDINVGGTPGISRENSLAFVHMAAADLISGVQNVDVVAFGQMLPQADVGGGFMIGFTADGAAVGGAGVGFPANQLRAGHYLVLSGEANQVTLNDLGLTPIIAAQIDRKLDDGVGNTGGIQVMGTNCADGTGVYNEVIEMDTCKLFIRVQS